MTCPTHPLPPARARHIKARLLKRVADADETHLTVHATQGTWQAFAPGIALKVLREHEGVLSYLLKLDAGATLPAHRHPLDEECVVLEGRLRVGTRTEIGPGGYHVAQQGALHATIGTTTGATIFLRGAIPEPGHALACI